MDSSIDGANTRLPVYPLRVLRIEPGLNFHVRTLSLMYGGVFTHFVRGRSHLCQGETCRADFHREQRIWKGYASVEVYDQRVNRWAPFVLEITEALELDLRGIYTRGQVWEIWREAQTGRKATPVLAKLTEERDEKTFPAAFDYVPVLKHLYHVERIGLDAVNPLPPRIILPTSEGDAPEALRKEPRKLVPPEISFAEEAKKRHMKARTTPTEKKVAG